MAMPYLSVYSINGDTNMSHGAFNNLPPAEHTPDMYVCDGQEVLPLEQLGALSLWGNAQQLEIDFSQAS